MILNAIHASKVRDVWPVVKDGLDAMLRKYKDRWIPEEVFRECTEGRAFLYMIDTSHDLMNRGFIVVKNFLDADGLALFVWILYAKPGELKESAVYKELLVDLDALAKKIGAKRIRHYSHRRGWTKLGFELRQHIYEREV